MTHEYFDAICARAGFRCDSDESGLSCMFLDGDAFTLAREGWTAS